jgi:hypothetical protein
MILAYFGAFFTGLSWMSAFAYIAIPIIIFCIVERFKETEDKKRYVLKMYAAALAASVIFNIVSCVCFFFTSEFIDIEENIFGAMFQGILLIYIIDMCINKADKYKLKLLIYVICQAALQIVFWVLANSSPMLSINWFMGPLSTVFINSFGILYLPLFVLFYYKKNYKIGSAVYLFIIFIIHVLNIFNRLQTVLNYHAAYLGRIYDIFMHRIIYRIPARSDVFSFKSLAIILPVLVLCLYNGKRKKFFAGALYATYVVATILLNALGYYCL